MKMTNEEIKKILDGATDGINLRHQNTNRNRTLNLTVCELSKIVNHHNPEVDAPIASGVWDCLDCMASELEAPLLREILELRQEVERLKAQLPKWVSVDDLPEHNTLVVAAHHYGNGIVPDAAVCRFYHGKFFLLYDGIYVESCCGASLSLDIDITHWMPLPQPPKEQNHE